MGKGVFGDSKDVTDWFNSFTKHAADTLHTVAKSPAARQVISQVEDGALKTLRALLDAELGSRGISSPLLTEAENAAESGIKAAVNKALDK